MRIKRTWNSPTSLQKWIFHGTPFSILLFVVEAVDMGLSSALNADSLLQYMYRTASLHGEEFFFFLSFCHTSKQIKESLQRVCGNNVDSEAQETGNYTA